MPTQVEAHARAVLMSYEPKASFLFGLSGVTCELSVVSFNVEEQISNPYEIDITLATQHEVLLEDFLDKKGLLTIVCGATRRYFHGIVRECICLGDNGDYTILHVHLVPSLWLLSLEQDCRVFQDMNVQDIVRMVMEESCIRSDHIRLALKDKARKREYCVQYRETDLNFVTRLLEEEEIFYFFEHYEDKHVIVFGDNPAAYLSMGENPRFRFDIDGEMATAEESVSSFHYSYRIYPGRVTLQDFNYNRNGLDLLTEKRTKCSPAREVYDYPGNYFKQGKGDFVTQIHTERIQSLGETAEGTSNCPSFVPGHTWELTNNDFAGKYLTVGVSHSGSQPQVLGEQAGSGSFHYHNNFLVIPADVLIRPQIVSEKRLISGIQTATVVGPVGEEIHTDDHGRIKVQFYWDRRGKKDGRSSCWIRVTQHWGGLNRGAQYIPRIGDEVLVQFAEGDPDRPIVTGSVYNGDNLPIYDLSKSVTQSGFRTKTHKGEGFNELRFDDANGSEEIFLHGQKDWNITIRNDETKKVGNDLLNLAGKRLSLEAGEQIKFSCGGASIQLDQSGKILIHGSEVFISGDTVNVDGKPIRLNVGG